MIVKRANRKLKTSNRVLLLLSLTCAVPVNGEIYEWQDDEGHVHFGDCPPAGRNVSPVEIAPGPTNRCGRRVDYLVKFTTAPEGGTLFSIKIEP